MIVWLVCAAAVLNLHQNGVLTCGLPKTGLRMLGTACFAEVKTRHSDSVVRDGDWTGYFFTATSK